MSQEHCLAEISFSDEYAYKDGPASWRELEIYTDNDIVWSEIGKHATLTEYGSSKLNFAEGFNKLLPEKAEELGYKQAYLEAVLGMSKSGASCYEIGRNLRLNEEQIRALLSAKIIKYRILPSSANEMINHTAAEHFKLGYNLAYEAIENGFMQEEPYEIEGIRKTGIACAMKEICKFLKGELLEKYIALYDGVI